MTAMFKKLFATSIVANNFFGLFNKEIISVICFGCSSEALSISVFVRENNATSAPDIKAEHNNSKTSVTMLKINEVLIFKSIIKKLLGSGSKIWNLN